MLKITYKLVCKVFKLVQKSIVLIVVYCMLLLKLVKMAIFGTKFFISVVLLPNFYFWSNRYINFIVESH